VTLLSQMSDLYFLPSRNNSLFRAEFLLYFAFTFFSLLPLNSNAFWKPRHESTYLFSTFQSYKSCSLNLYCDNSLSNVLHYSKQQDSLPKTKTTNSPNQFRPSLDIITLTRRRCATERSPQVSLKRQSRYCVT